MIFSNKHISIASQSDVRNIQQLLNSAYRGEASKKGWTTEAHLIEGDTRATEEQITEVMNQPGSVFLKYTPEGDKAAACVNLQKHGNRIYLGMFAVNPEIQGGGIGKQLLFAAEEYALHESCNSIYMSVIDIRKELIAWYVRHGYNDTGKRDPFPEEAETGRHTRSLQFMILEKQLPQSSERQEAN